MRFTLMAATFLMAFVMCGIATLGLSHAATGDSLSVFTVAQLLGEIALAVIAVLLAFEIASDSWRSVVSAFLLLIAAQRLWFLLFERHDNWPAAAWILSCAFVLSPPIIVLLSLSILNNLRKVVHIQTPRLRGGQASHSLSVLLQSTLIVCASVTLLFSSFDLCLGQDLFGVGPPVLLSSLPAVGGSLATVLFALKPSKLHRRTNAIVAVALALAMRIARAMAISNVMLQMDSGGWTATICIAFGPLAAILAAAIAYPLSPGVPLKFAQQAEGTDGKT